MSNYSCPREEQTTKLCTYYCCDKSNIVHQGNVRMLSKISRPALKIPLCSRPLLYEKNILYLTRKRILQLLLLMEHLFSVVAKIVHSFDDMKKNQNRKHILNNLLSSLFFKFIIIVLINNRVYVNCAVGAKIRDADTIAELCKNFTVGNGEKMEFASPQYGHEYPQNLQCFRTITADHGYFVRIDFRDIFNVEPPSNEGNCDYDYLEIRDGDQGYSPLIGMNF